MERTNRRCKLCKQPILRAPTAGRARAPFDAAPIIGGPWRMELGLMRYQPRIGGLGYMSHYRTCNAQPVDATRSV